MRHCLPRDRHPLMPLSPNIYHQIICLASGKLFSLSKSPCSACSYVVSFMLCSDNPKDDRLATTRHLLHESNHKKDAGRWAYHLPSYNHVDTSPFNMCYYFVRSRRDPSRIKIEIRTGTQLKVDLDDRDKRAKKSSSSSSSSSRKGGEKKKKEGKEKRRGKAKMRAPDRMCPACSGTGKVDANVPSCGRSSAPQTHVHEDSHPPDSLWTNYAGYWEAGFDDHDDVPPPSEPRNPAPTASPKPNRNTWTQQPQPQPQPQTQTQQPSPTHFPELLVHPVSAHHLKFPVVDFCTRGRSSSACPTYYVLLVPENASTRDIEATLSPRGKGYVTLARMMGTHETARIGQFGDLEDLDNRSFQLEVWRESDVGA
ncbi:hypothetical protein F4778DRAFT_759613 [Xylariomycetidae sp. FL2044]|nr:hypothetical protein F4778DRAFT_759613 [Xylariomycetidae sp. FL2044]